MYITNIIRLSTHIPLQTYEQKFTNKLERERHSNPSVAVSHDVLARCRLPVLPLPLLPACCSCVTEECCRMLSWSLLGMGRLRSWKVSLREDMVLQVRHCTELTMVPSNMSEIMLRYEGGFLLLPPTPTPPDLPGPGEVEAVTHKFTLRIHYNT